MSWLKPEKATSLGGYIATPVTNDDGNVILVEDEKTERERELRKDRAEMSVYKRLMNYLHWRQYSPDKFWVSIVSLDSSVYLRVTLNTTTREITVAGFNARNVSKFYDVVFEITDDPLPTHAVQVVWGALKHGTYEVKQCAAIKHHTALTPTFVYTKTVSPDDMDMFFPATSTNT